MKKVIIWTVFIIIVVGICYSLFPPPRYENQQRYAVAIDDTAFNNKPYSFLYATSFNTSHKIGDRVWIRDWCEKDPEKFTEYFVNSHQIKRLEINGQKFYIVTIGDTAVQAYPGKIIAYPKSREDLKDKGLQ